MTTRSVTTCILCYIFLIAIPTFIPNVEAMRRSSDVDAFMVENQRTRKQQNYVVQKDFNDEVLENNDNTGVPYDTEPFEMETNPDELSSFIVDYANMIRNDVVLLDNSVETRTRKRGNIKVEKHNNAIPDPPCSCEYRRETIDLGDNFYPRYIETRNCSSNQETTCLRPYMCKESMYNLPILKRRELSQRSSTKLPSDLRHHWIPEKQPVSVGCVCTKAYVIPI